MNSIIARGLTLSTVISTSVLISVGLMGVSYDRVIQILLCGVPWCGREGQWPDGPVAQSVTVRSHTHCGSESRKIFAGLH
jgi:hypothetical protein